MTTLEKLGILGIRSFSPEIFETLVFERPLTLIVGHNGAGKTTIVECLKMSTTGELPPNAGKGQHFIHNPRSTDAPEVKGQIRLVFKTAQQKSILANRSFQLSNTKDRKGRIKTSYKALESVLQVKDADGATRSLNKKCAEMDLQIPRLMGVSKAILENVVFCHQEESNWPLGEMAKLKKKFDDLFGATRYSKALEAIHTVRKEHQKIGKEKLHELEVLSAHLEQAQSLRNKIEKSRQKQLVFQNEMQFIQETMEEQQNQIDQARSALASVQKIETDVAVRKHLSSTLQYEVEVIKNLLTEHLNESPDELRRMQADLIRSAQIADETVISADQEIYRLEQLLQEIARRKEVAEQEKIEATKADVRLGEALKRRGEIVSKVEHDFGAHIPSIDLTTHSIDVDPNKRVLDALKLAKKEELKEHETRSFSILTEISKKQNQVQNELTQSEERLRREISECQSQLAEESATRDDLLSISSKLKAVEESQRTGSIDKKLQELENEVIQLREQRQNLGKNLEKATAQIQYLESHSTLQHQLNSEENNLKEKKIQSEAKATGLRLFYHEVMEMDLNLNNLMIKELLIKISDTQNIIVKSQNNRTEKEKELGQLTGKLQLITKEIEDLKEEHKQHEDNLRKDKVEYIKFSESLQQQREKVEDANKNLITTQNAELLFTNYLTKSIQKNKCYFCTRTMTLEEVENLKINLTKQIDKLPTAIETNTFLLEKEKVRLDQIERMQGVVMQLERVMKFLPQREQEQNQLDHEIRCLRGILEDVEEQLHIKTKKLSEFIELKYSLESLKNDLDEIRRYEIRLGELKIRLQEEQQQNNDGNSGENRLNGARQQIQEINRLLKDLDQVMNLKETEMSNLRSKKTSELVELGELNIKKQSLEHKAARINDIRKQLESKIILLNSLIESLPSLKELVQSVRQQEQAVRNEFQIAQSDHNNGVQRLNRALQDLDIVADELTKVCASIVEAQVAQTAAVDVLERLKKLDHSMKEMTASLQEKRKLSADSRNDIARSKILLETVEKNLRYHEKIEELARVNEELRTLRESTGTGEDPQELKEKLDKLLNERNQISNDISLKKGEQKSNQEWVAQHHNELKASKYKNIDKLHQHALIDCETELMVIRDLQKYHSALDKALMKYHTVKVTQTLTDDMQQINRTIRQLWQTTYKGRDIDFIAIRSDTEEELQFATTVQRSYNYRVTMVKDCVELEMRGRCSAGQKVLASIVIRLALAESFCVDCGILALDEPTTNLDKENMEGLARALADLIEDRRSCANFQLILITHDEEFVRMLARHQPCDSFFQITKDSEGYSTIRRKDIRGF